MNRIDLNTFKPKSPQQKLLVEYEKELAQSEKDFKEVQKQYEELEVLLSEQVNKVNELHSLLQEEKTHNAQLRDIVDDYSKQDIKRTDKYQALITFVELEVNGYLKNRLFKSTHITKISNYIKTFKDGIS